MRKILKSKSLWFMVILAIAGTWWFLGRDTEEVMETVTVERGDIVEMVDVSGSLKPDNSVDAAFEMLGTLTEVHVEVGDVVEEGDEIARIDRSVLLAQLSESSIALDIAELSERQARRSWDDLSPDEKQTHILTTEAARADINTLKRRVAKTTLFSPASGRVTEVYKESGEVVSAGVSIAQIITEETMYIEADVSESDIAQLSPGQKAVVTFDAFTQEETLSAVVGEIDPQSTVIQDVVYYRAVFYLEEWDDRLRPGMSADVDIEVGLSEHALKLPQRAVYEDDEGTYAQVLVGEETQRRAIETGLEDEEGYVEILSGVEEGDIIVL